MAERSGARNGPGHYPPPWGPTEVGLGIVAALSLVILSVFALAGLALLAGLPDDSLLLRYLVFATSEGCLLLVATGALLFSGAGMEALGVTPPASRLGSLGEGLAAGALLVFLTRGWTLALARWAPLLHERLLAEEQRQLQFLEGPWPLLVVAALFVAPVTEELFFRGFVFGGLRSRLDFPLASALSALIFALVHLMPVSSPPLFLVGLATATLYERNRSLAPALTAHVTYNGIALLATFLGWWS